MVKSTKWLDFLVTNFSGLLFLTSLKNGALKSCNIELYWQSLLLILLVEIDPIWLLEGEVSFRVVAFMYFDCQS